MAREERERPHRELRAIREMNVYADKALAALATARKKNKLAMGLAVSATTAYSVVEKLFQQAELRIPRRRRSCGQRREQRRRAVQE